MFLHKLHVMHMSKPLVEILLLSKSFRDIPNIIFQTPGFLPGSPNNNYFFDTFSKIKHNKA